MNRTDRLYALREELRRAGESGRTAERLAAVFEVSTRTVKRDLVALQLSGFPIRARTGPGGGYVVETSATLPPVNFTPAQAVAIAAALAAHPDSPYLDDGRAALAKLRDVMGEETRGRADELAQRVWVNTTIRPAGRAARVVEQAVAEQRVLVIDYAAGSGEVTTRAVEPQLLARTNDRWYLVAWCRLRADVRWFRRDRILRARLTAERAPQRDLVELGTPPASARPVAG